MIYVASRVRHARLWKLYRANGIPIISSWIDEAGAGETENLTELWDRIVSEISESRALVFYAAGPEDFPFKGALVEAGIALTLEKPVYVALEHVTLEGPTLRPIGSWVRHRNVLLVDDLEIALAGACS